MNYELVIILEGIRELLKVPIRINSGYRTQEHNELLRANGYKASKNSSHMIGKAVDIHCPSNQFRHNFIKSCMKFGITRFGIGNSFIHIDNDKDKPQNTMWRY
jgi:uncharacterized protein YcbK (DUF882 family)